MEENTSKIKQMTGHRGSEKREGVRKEARRREIETGSWMLEKLDA